jgi:hypothetical protein
MKLENGQPALFRLLCKVIRQFHGVCWTFYWTNSYSGTTCWKKKLSWRKTDFVWLILSTVIIKNKAVISTTNFHWFFNVLGYVCALLYSISAVIWKKTECLFQLNFSSCLIFEVQRHDMFVLVILMGLSHTVKKVRI